MIIHNVYQIEKLQFHLWLLKVKVRGISNINKTFLVIGNESYLTYSRTMITKAPIIGFDISKFMIHDSSWYEEKRITTIINKKVTNISNDDKTNLEVTKLYNK